MRKNIILNDPMSFNLDDWETEINYIISITEFCKQTNEIEYDIYEAWYDETGKKNIQIKPAGHPLYRDMVIREQAYNHARKQIYEKERNLL
jgi:hypothetical protein